MRNPPSQVRSLLHQLVFAFFHSCYSRYDNVFVKGGAKEAGCKELFEPYQKCALVFLGHADLLT